MPYEFEDRVYVDLVFNGQTFPFDRVNNLNFLHISTSTKIGVPMLHMSLHDQMDFFSDSLTLSDGCLIRARVGKSASSIDHDYLFRLNSVKRTSSSPGTNYEIDAYLDVSNYWHNTANLPFKGTSYSLMENIAKVSGMTFAPNEADTKDQQVWWPGNRRFFQWAWSVCEESFKSESSHMQMAITPTKELRFSDVTVTPKTNWDASFMIPRVDHILVTDFLPNDNSGSGNHLTTYGSNRVKQDLLGSKLQELEDTMRIDRRPDELSFRINSDIISQVTRGQVEFAPLDWGNTHKNLQRGKYQNQRMSALFSGGCSILTSESTKVMPLDGVNLFVSQSGASGNEFNSMYSGRYIVSTKSIYVHTNNFYERMDLVRKAYPVRMKKVL